MTKRKVPTSNYIVIGTCAQGMDLHVLQLLKRVKKTYKAEVIHIGAIATPDEIRMFHRRMGTIRTWKGTNKERKQKVLSEIDALVQVQEDRITKLAEHGVDLIITNKEHCINWEQLSKRPYVIDNSYDLGDHLVATSMPANGYKVSSRPITNRTKTSLRRLKKSVILAHATPQTISVEKEGINHATIYKTTGSLTPPKKPKRNSDTYQSNMLPSFVLVGINQENGEYHMERLRIRTSYDNKYRESMPAIVRDGVLFVARENPKTIDSNKILGIITDSHTGAHNLGTMKSFISCCKTAKVGYVAHLGDVSDFSSICPHTTHNLLKREGLRLVDDLEQMGEYLSKINSELDIIIDVIDSNHHNWLSRFVEKNPCLEGLCDWATIRKKLSHICNIKLENNSQVVEKFGDLALRHGHQERSVEKAINIFDNYICGHYHSFYEYLDYMRLFPSCNLTPSYLQGNITSWQNGFGIACIHAGRTWKNAKIVLHSGNKSRYYYRDTIYEVK